MREDVITGSYTSNLFTTRSAYHPVQLKFESDIDVDELVSSGIYPVT